MEVLPHERECWQSLLCAELASSHCQKSVARAMLAAPMRTTKSFSVTVPKELVTEVECAAKGQGRSRSSYLAWLIRKDAPSPGERRAPHRAIDTGAPGNQSDFYERSTGGRIRACE